MTTDGGPGGQRGGGARLDELVAKLKAIGCRITSQRVAIIEALTTSEHPTVEEVYRQVQGRYPMTSQVTVYRTLDLLREIGEVLPVELAPPATHYDGNRPHEHPHLVCVVCGRVVDAPDLDISSLTADLARRSGAWALGSAVQFLGTCPQCAAPSARPGHCPGIYLDRGSGDE